MLLHLQSNILQGRVLTIAGGKAIQEAAKRKKILQVKYFLYVYHSDTFIIIFFPVFADTLSPVFLFMPHMPCLYNALCAELVLQIVKRHSFWLLSYLNIPLAMGTFFSKSMSKQLAAFACSFSIPLNSLFFLFLKKF